MERIKWGCWCMTELCHWINLYYDVSIWRVIYVVYGLQEERWKDTARWWMAREALTHSGRMQSKAGCLMSCITNCFICTCFKPLLLKQHMSPVTLLVFLEIPHQTQRHSFSLLLDVFRPQTALSSSDKINMDDSSQLESLPSAPAF